MFRHYKNTSGWNVAVPKGSFATLADAKNAFAGTIVQYELATPIYTPISDLNLTSYKGLTNITTTANPQVNLVAKFKSKLNNTYEVLVKKIEELTNRINQLEGTV